MGPTHPICSILTFIGEQGQLKKLSDNFADFWEGKTSVKDLKNKTV